MLKAQFLKYTLKFKKPGGTSRGVLHDKDSWFILAYEDKHPEKMGIGECSIIKNLSIDDRPDFESKLTEITTNIHHAEAYLESGLFDFPSIRFGLETALKDLQAKRSRILYPSMFTEGIKNIPINGLIWMGNTENMYQQAVDKVEAGFNCIKIKIGAIDFEEELLFLKRIRKDFKSHDLELRVDANGAFNIKSALEKLKRLSEFHIHSIEQPIVQGQWAEMARLCSTSPIPIAIDEELLGMHDLDDFQRMFQTVKPQYIILKPSLVGGINQCEKIIRLAEKNSIGWWVTSALESNIGLNAIAQWAATLKTSMHQGLGTGQLFENNLSSPLSIKNGALHYDDHKSWKLKALKL